MSPDHRLPTTQEELRDWLAQAWQDGWAGRKGLIGKPAGTIHHAKPRLLDSFLQSWDLPPMPKPPVISVREGIAAMLADDTDKDTK